jgi:hypothetical protein
MKKPNFIKPRHGDTKLYNLSLVYKIEKSGVDYKFYFIGGDTMTINSGHVSDEIKALMEG